MKNLLSSSLARRTINRRDAGFTLIELLVVVIIIGILAAIAIPVYIGVQNNSKDTAVKSDLHADKIALTHYSLEQGRAPTQGEAYAIVTSPETMKQYSFVQSPSTASFGYLTNGSGASMTWCLIGVGVTGNYFYVTTNGPVGKGMCPAASTW